MRLTPRREISRAVRHTLTSVGYVMWVAAVIQLRVVRIQMYIHTMVLNHIVCG